jgi:hypothetical protein
MAYLHVSAERAFKKLNKALVVYNQEGMQTVEQLAQIGMWHAKAIAPHDTGYTASLITTRVYKTPEGARAQIIARNPTANDGHPRRIKNFNLVRWMHTSPNAARHIYSGDRLFMYTTRDYLNKIKKSVAKGKHRRINIT